MKFIKKYLFIIGFCGLLSNHQTHSLPTTALSLTAGVLVAALLPRLQTPFIKPRYDQDVLKHPLKSGMPTYLHHLRFLITDGLIGHVGQKDPHNQKQWLIAPHGLCGRLFSKIPLPTLFGFITAPWIMHLWNHSSASAPQQIPPSEIVSSNQKQIPIASQQKNNVASPDHNHEVIDLTQDDQDTIDVVTLHVPRQTDGHTCGDRAICMAKTLSQLVTSHQSLDQPTIKATFTARCKQNAPYHDRSENNYLSGQQLYEFAEAMNIDSVYVFNTNGKSYLPETRGMNHHRWREQLNKQFAAFQAPTEEPKIAHFVYNRGGNHWVLFTIIKNQTVRVLYTDSFNQSIESDQNTAQFSTKLQRSLADGKSHF